MNVAGQDHAGTNSSEPAGPVEKTAGQKFIALVLSILPWAIVGTLLWAGLFVKPTAVIEEVTPPAIDRRDNILGVTRVGPDVYWAAGNYGKILISTDRAKTWTNQNSTVDIHFQDIAAWDENRAVAVGNKGVAVVTDDGGKTWTSVETPKSEISNKLLKVHVSPGGEALAVGEMGMIIQSLDYGNTWKRLRDEEDVFFNDVARTNENTIIIAAEARAIEDPDAPYDPHQLVPDAYGLIFKSDDNGETWRTIKTDSLNSFAAIDFRNELEGVAVGLSGTIVGTFDGGDTWSHIDSKTSGMKEHLMDVAWSEHMKEWVGIGNKGKWIIFSGDLSSFDTRFLTEADAEVKDFTSHSELALTGDGGFIGVGETVGYMDLETNQWTLLH
ncbi:WD40/YVTN/BNR-like repeat-containing protein [Porticoccus hydrocarbonoclasticus]|uniref:WD40/YVTN/BNR-like repeat-containing protein n=1 Tax=Porticoccus hydrocarbonoclasticus TaxID=1073414 RepID=UPI000691C174|nr:YCF48-related protein [Porticoccus hydrocarbonoclasticus]